MYTHMHIISFYMLLYLSKSILAIFNPLIIEDDDTPSLFIGRSNHLHIYTAKSDFSSPKKNFSVSKNKL